MYRTTRRSRYWMLAAGIKGGDRQGRVRLYYQALFGAFGAHSRRDHEWPASIDTEAENAACGGYVNGVLVFPCENVPYPEFDEQHRRAFVMQPGMGVDVDVWRRLTIRVAADLPIFASSDYVVLRPRLICPARRRVGALMCRRLVLNWWCDYG